MFLAADGIGDLTGSSGILGFILGGGLLTVIIGAYRFFVNFRTTERGWAKGQLDDARKAEAVSAKRVVRALDEARAWQGRCADLEYLLRSSNVPVPPLPAELVRYMENDNDPPGEKRRGPESGKRR